MNKTTPLVLMALLIAFAAGTMLYAPMASTAVGDAVAFKGGIICACVNSAECNEQTPGAVCEHNVLTNIGKNATRAYLSTGSLAAFDYLALGNGTTPVATSTTLDQEVTCCTLARQQATVYNNGIGNWSLVYTWTASDSAESVNTTAIFNQSSGGTLLAGGQFTSVNLEANDQLTINYTLWVS